MEITNNEILGYLEKSETRHLWIDIFERQNIDYIGILYETLTNPTNRSYTKKELAEAIKSHKYDNQSLLEISFTIQSVNELSKAIDAEILKDLHNLNTKDEEN